MLDLKLICIPSFVVSGWMQGRNLWYATAFSEDEETLCSLVINNLLLLSTNSLDMQVIMEKYFCKCL